MSKSEQILRIQNQHINMYMYTITIVLHPHEPTVLLFITIITIHYFIIYILIMSFILRFTAQSYKFLSLLRLQNSQVTIYNITIQIVIHVCLVT